MNLTFGDRTLHTPCTGCACHRRAAREDAPDSCPDCGCPQTEAEFDRRYSDQDAGAETVVIPGARAARRAGRSANHEVRRRMVQHTLHGGEQ